MGDILTKQAHLTIDIIEAFHYFITFCLKILKNRKCTKTKKQGRNFSLIQGGTIKGWHFYEDGQTYNFH